MVLSVLGWQTSTLPSGRKATLTKSSKVLHSAHIPMSNAQASAARRASNYAGHTSNTSPPPLWTQVNERNHINTLGAKHDDIRGSYKIVPELSVMDSFVYERSEESDSLTYYSNDSAETFRKLLDTEHTLSNVHPSYRLSALQMKGTLEVTGPRSHSPPDAPCPPAIPLPPTHPYTAAERRNNQQDSPFPAREDAQSLPRRRGGSVDSDRQVPFPEVGPPSRQVSPPTGHIRRTSITASSRPEHLSRVDPPRMRRLSSGGPVIPTGFGILPCERPPTSVKPPSDRPSPPMIRASPSKDIGTTRERHSPEREVSPVADIGRDRRSSVIMVGSPERDRPPLRRGSQSSSSSSSVGRHSPPDDSPLRGLFAPIIRSRKLSRRHKKDGPKHIIVDGLDQSSSQGGGRTVRFSEQLICPSPVPIERRRRGWFNRKGQQLWTNDGMYVEPEIGQDFPLEFAEYPEPGTGWQSEEGIRIDMQHRLIPKVPLRPALKRSGTSNSSGYQSQASTVRGDGRPFAVQAGLPIHEEP